MRHTPHVVVRDIVSTQSKRHGATIALIVMHDTEGANIPHSAADLRGLARYFDSTLNTPRASSSHTSVDGDGSSGRMVDDDYKAWHCAYYNSVSLGCELIGKYNQRDWPAAQVEEAARWIAYWCYHHKLPCKKGAVSREPWAAVTSTRGHSRSLPAWSKPAVTFDTTGANVQQTVPFKLPGNAPVTVRIGVGDERYRMQIVTASAAPLGIDSSVCGWFGREIDKTAADKAMNVANTDADYEFMAVCYAPSPWFDVPQGTAFVVLQSLVGHRGLLILEECPPKPAPPRPDGPPGAYGPGRPKSPAGS
jgi:hypothetical protein